MRGRRTPGLPRRRRRGLLLLLAGTAGSGVAVRALAAPPLRALLARRPTDSDVLAALPLDQLVTAGCAAALTACWLWLASCAWLVAGQVLHEGAAGARDRRLQGCPRLVRVLVLVVLGATASTPAHAAPAPVGTGTGERGPGLTGLAVPDRVHAAVARRRVVRVRPGDSLWRVAERALPDGAPDAAVDRAWRRIAAANRDRLGPDPDLIFPGTLLRVPEAGRALGKDDR